MNYLMELRNHLRWIVEIGVDPSTGTLRSVEFKPKLNQIRLISDWAFGAHRQLVELDARLDAQNGH